MHYKQISCIYQKLGKNKHTGISKRKQLNARREEMQRGFFFNFFYLFIHSPHIILTAIMNHDN